ncbi:MAG: histone deacetylase family protein, partial [Longimicrobiales bacterium]
MAADGPPSTGFYLHPAAVLHDTGWGHPEHQGRLRTLASTVGKDLIALVDHVEHVEPAPASVEQLEMVHHPDQIARVLESVEEARKSGTVTSIDADTRVSGASWEAALGTVGAGLAATTAVAEGQFRNAFVAARPPGHHATPNQAMGFCLFNNIAIAARHLQRNHGAERILIVDWDVHHGNGTQDAFYDDPSVCFLSIHQSPHYPGTGAAGEVGEGAGVGFTINVPIPAAMPRAQYRTLFEAELEGAVAKSNPDFILVSSGFDVLDGDPLG